MDEFSTELLVVGLLMFGAVLHGVTGLGFPMISTMSVAIIFPLPTAIALVVLPNVVINLAILAPSKTLNRKDGVIFFAKKHWLLIVSSVVGCIAGVVVLKHSPMSWMYLLLSLATLFYIFYSLFGGSNKALENDDLKNNKASMIGFGGLAGVVGGATNAMSSILMMYLLAASDNKNEIVKTSNLCFLLAKIVQIVFLQQELTQLGARELLAIPVITIMSMLALYLGIKLRDRISIVLFKKFVLIMLLGLSIQAGWRAFTLL